MWFAKPGQLTVLILEDRYPDTVKRLLSEGWTVVPDPRESAPAPQPAPAAPPDPEPVAVEEHPLVVLTERPRGRRR